jgi:hypothetical protein
MEDDLRNCRLEKLFAVKLAQPITEPKSPRFVEQAVSRACKKRGFNRASCVQLSHYTGGSRDEEALMCCIVFGGDACGWTVEDDLAKAIQLAYTRATHGWPTQGTVCIGQTVRIRGLLVESEIIGELGLAVHFNGENDLWLVRLLRTGDWKQLKPISLEGMEGECGRVFCYWGYESWTRNFLLEGISGGCFVTCSANVGDLVVPPEECWKNVIGRCTPDAMPQNTLQDMEHARIRCILHKKAAQDARGGDDQ